MVSSVKRKLENVVFLIILSVISSHYISTNGHMIPLNFDFVEAIEDVDTIAPAQQFSSQNSMKMEDEDLAWSHQRDQEDHDHPIVTVIQSTDFLRDCGRDDTCPPENTDSSYYNYSIRPSFIDYKFKPYVCRCDKECHLYGDCCHSQMVGSSLRNDTNMWACKYVHEKTTWAMMISRCNATSPGMNYLSDMCVASPGKIPDQNYTYLIDIPVYSNISKKLYRNIYCARCHSEKNPDLVHWKTRLYCNEVMSPEEQSVFIQKAYYYPGHRYFQMENRTCAIYISDLYNATSLLKSTIPTVRYCGESIDTCPPSGPGHSNDHYLVSDSEGGDEIYTSSSLSEDTRFCSSYTQHVSASNGLHFKNPHCARCNGIALDSMNNTVAKLGGCYYGPPLFTMFKQVPIGPIKGPPQGISLLFDFALDSDEVLVGYENLCGDDEIWDYIHRRCQMAICKKGYYLQDESCHPMLAPIKQQQSGSGDNDDSDNGSSVKDNPFDDPINSTCMRILVFEYEYSFVSANNTSIIINSSVLGKADNFIIFHPDEYEFWNETTLAICAKDLHEGFVNRFSWVLNYISTISLAISVIFSFIHILLYLALPKLRNLPGKNLFCLTVCLFVSQLIFLTLINHSRWHGLCVTAAITMHYLFLAAFFWMSVMSFDIWRTFSGAVVLSRNQSPEGKQITFLKYNLFAWLTPLVIVSVALLVEFLPGNFESNPSFMDPSENMILGVLEKIRPSYGGNGLCWIGQRLSLFIFFAVPVALVITSNLILFSLTAQAILSQNKEKGKVLQNQESKMACAKKSSNTSGTSRDHEEIKVRLYAKLALIMGLSWTLGFISNFFRNDVLWYPFVIFNGLQGTFIFFAFDFKWKILRMLRERWERCWQGRSKGQRFGRRGMDGGTISTSASVSYSRTMSTSLENK